MFFGLCALTLIGATLPLLHERHRKRPPPVIKKKSHGKTSDQQIKISFAEEQIDALNKLVYQQQRQIEWLVGELRQLQSRAEQGQPGEWHGSCVTEIPPHY